jgi:mono/diheme cytochrome c family protein
MNRGVPQLAPLLAFVAMAFVASGCGTGPRPGASARGGAADSSFVALSSARSRSPLEISVASGRPVYGRYCAVCHGETGGGDGFNAYNVKAAFGVSPAAFSDSSFMASLRDSVALAAIRDGGPAVGKSPAMPPWGGTLTASEIADLWNFARSLAAGSHE